MQNRIRINIYNYNNLLLWENEKKKIPDKIAQEKQKASAEQKLIDFKLPSFNSLQSQLEPFESALSKLSTQKLLLITTRSVLLQSQDKDTAKNQQIKKIDAEIFQLNNDIHFMEVSRLPIATEKDKIQRFIDQHEYIKSNTIDNIKKLNQYKETLEEQIIEASIFLGRLLKSPKQLVNQLSLYIDKELESYKVNYPANQNENVRICILELKQRKKQITINSDEKSDGYRKQYHQLCGLLGSIHNRLENSNPDSLFIQSIARLLDKTHIPINGDLPDQFALGVRCVDHYHDLYPEISKIQLQQFEEDEYFNTLKLLQSKLTRLDEIKLTDKKQNTKLKNLVKIGQNLTSHIEKERIMPDFDIHLAILMMKTTNQLLESDNKIVYKKKMMRLAEYDKNGKPSLAKKVGGILLALFATVIIAASALAAVASFGIATPLTAIGVSIGTTMIAQSTSIAIGTVGLFSLIGGIGLRRHGRRKGISKDLCDFVDQINDTTPTLTK